MTPDNAIWISSALMYFFDNTLLFPSKFYGEKKMKGEIIIVAPKWNFFTVN